MDHLDWRRTWRKLASRWTRGIRLILYITMRTSNLTEGEMRHFPLENTSYCSSLGLSHVKWMCLLHIFILYSLMLMLYSSLTVKRHLISYIVYHTNTGFYSQICQINFIMYALICSLLAVIVCQVSLCFCCLNRLIFVCHWFLLLLYEISWMNKLTF